VTHPPAAVVVLAAGEGTRMKSRTPKVLHPIAGRPLLGHAVAAAAGVAPQTLTVVVGHGRESVTDYLRSLSADLGRPIEVAVQEQQKGTGHAVECALSAVRVDGGTLVVTYGDVPLLESATLERLLDTHDRAGAAVTVLSARVADPTGYGRIVRDADEAVAAIVEQRDADDAQRAIDEINSGIYAFDVAALRGYLSSLEAGNDQGELYLTDVVGLARADGRVVASLTVTDTWQTEGVNDRIQLATLGAELNRRLLRGWMASGVTVVDPASTWVDSSVRLEPDSTLLPGVHLSGATRVSSGATVGPDSSLHDTVVEADASVVRSHVTGARIGAGATVGPFTYLRPGADLGPGSKAGAYVEIKGASVGAGSKVPHLSYVGDAEIGEGSNIGAATVFVNYDGVAKHRTVVGEHVRIGSDTMLVAPVSIGDGAYTAAGSVITDDVPPGAMAVGRARQRTIRGWVRRRRAGSAAAKAAEAAESGTATEGEAPASPSSDGVGHTAAGDDGRVS
jgi:bifunctional UDP-N-acetylglucosamine pyrophosphorylase/glucosamine-1-phosphate N-acetyltransferase